MDEHGYEWDNISDSNNIDEMLGQRFHSHGDTPEWMVFGGENPIQKWMKTGGTPISGNRIRQVPPYQKYILTTMICL